MAKKFSKVLDEDERQETLRNYRNAKARILRYVRSQGGDVERFQISYHGVQSYSLQAFDLDGKLAADINL